MLNLCWLWTWNRSDMRYSRWGQLQPTRQDVARRNPTSKELGYLVVYESFPDVFWRRERRRNVVTTSRGKRRCHNVMKTSRRKNTSGKLSYTTNYQGRFDVGFRRDVEWRFYDVFCRVGRRERLALAVHMLAVYSKGLCKWSNYLNILTLSMSLF